MTTVRVTASAVPRADVPASAEPRLGVVTVAYGTGPVILDMLESLVGSLAGDGVAYEVVVVDNPHPLRPGRTARLLDLFTRGVQVVTPDRNLGFGGGCELGVLHTTGEMLAFVNPDLVFAPGWLPALLGRVEARRAAAGPVIVAPVLRNPDGTVQEAGHLLDAEGETTPLTALPDAPLQVDHASAACWLVARADHERVGGFDPAYSPAYFEDVDLALRARALGGGCWIEPSVSVVHHSGRGTPDTPAPAYAQRDELRARWPELRWTQPPKPGRTPLPRQRP